MRKLDDRFGLNPGMAGFERLYKDVQLAIVRGCGYDNPPLLAVCFDGLLAHRHAEQRR